jgi:hypothetical protein
MKHPNPLRPYKAQLKMALLILLITSPFLVLKTSCQGKNSGLQKNGIPLHYYETTMYKDKPNKDKDSLYLFNEKIFQIAIYSITTQEKTTYIAENKLSEPPYRLPRTVTGFFICKPDSSAKIFNSEIEFLNYMKSFDYGMINRNEEKYKIKFTFEKK